MRPTMTLLFAVLASAIAAMGTPAFAQDEALGGSFITPFPPNDTYQLAVVGDSLADGMQGGLNDALRGDVRVQIARKVEQVSGLMRSDFEEEMRGLEEALQRDPPHIVVIMVGAYDRVSLKGAGNSRRIAIGSPEWKQEYARRVDRVMKTLKRRNIAVYWVGLPIFRRWDANEDVQAMNEVVRERVYLNGQKYIDAYAGFVDEDGSYSAHGPDLSGKMRLLRDGDGIHFTDMGNRKLAHFVERELKRDLAQARNERNIPLAGNEAEQARINPEKLRLAAAAAGAKSASQPQGGARSTGKGNASSTAAVDTTGEQSADNGRISFKAAGANGREETVTVDIIRPAIPASVLSLVTRRASSEKASNIGEAIVDQIPGGLTVMSSITPAGASRRKLSPTQSPFFRVLVKGERVAPKPGRADDMPWPRPVPPVASAANAIEQGSSPADVSREGTPDPAALPPDAPQRRRRP